MSNFLCENDGCGNPMVARVRMCGPNGMVLNACEKCKNMLFEGATMNDDDELEQTKPKKKRKILPNFIQQIEKKLRTEEEFLLSMEESKKQFETERKRIIDQQQAKLDELDSNIESVDFLMDVQEGHIITLKNLLK